MIKKSITVTSQQNDWIKSQMATGNYATDSELIREALRDKQMRQDEMDILRAKLLEAEESGFTHMTRKEILSEIKNELRKNGEL